MNITITTPGMKFGRWTVVALDNRRTANRGLRWMCRCDCGVEKVVAAMFLRDGRSKSCGCLHRESARLTNTTHGLSGTVEHAAWQSMWARCRSTKAHNAKRYKDRGIQVCKEWESVEQFVADMGLRPSDKHSLDRIDNDGNYCKENCRWATRKEQQNNTRHNRRYSFQGKFLTIREWSKETGINEKSLHSRLSLLKWTLERALTEPIKPRARCL